jgi:hypothetical protein
MLISDKADFKQKLVSWDKDHYIIKGIIHEEIITIISM